MAGGVRSRLGAGLVATASLACVCALGAAPAGAAGFSHAPGSPFATPGATGALALGDLNGDGQNDAVVADPDADALLILPGGERGSLGPASAAIPTGAEEPSALAIADLNADGRQDVVAANNGSKSVSVLLGDGAGGLTPAAKSPYATAGSRPASVAVGHFNGDGKLDVAVVHRSSGDVSVMLGDGLGALTRAAGSPSSTHGFHPGPTAAGDFTGDGKLDLAIGNESGNVVVLAGDGAGRLARAGASAFGLAPAAIGAGDLNADGLLDVAVANETGTISLLLGNGTGGLSRLPAAIPAGAAPSALVVADLDSDGRLDLAVANAGSADVSILFGDGAAGFTPAPATPVPAGGVAPSALAAAEMNGDGKPDLVAVNAGSASVAVLLNAVTSAAFVSFPASPAPGEAVTFVYSAVSPVDALAWDLDGNGVFDDAQGPTAMRSFAAPGAYRVGLRVTDLDGAVAISTQTIVVGIVAAPQALAPVAAPRIYPALMSPFPIVRVAGRTSRRGARIRKLAVLAPAGAKVSVRCRGKGCPFRAWRRTVGRKTLLIKPLAGRFLRAGVTLEVRVYEANTIGKYTKLVIRKRRPPARSDLCLPSGSSRPTPCPAA